MSQASPPVRLISREATASGLVRAILANGLIETHGMNRVIHVPFHGQDFDPVEYVG